MNNRVYILGAGFSAEAGIPLTSKLLTKAMKFMKDEEPVIFESINTIVSSYYKIDNSTVDYSFINLSELLTIIHFLEVSSYAQENRDEIGQSEMSIAFRYYLSKVIALSTPLPDEVPNFYNRFISELKPSDIILSFNWDYLLESLLTKNKINFNHNFLLDNNILISKLHGSVHWSFSSNSNSKYKWSPIGLLDHYNVGEVYYSNDLMQKDNWLNPYSQAKHNPLLVLPGLGKSFDVLKLASYWSNLLYAMDFAKQIFILGLGLANDDFLISKMLMDIFPQLREEAEIIIVNPDPYTRNNYAFLLGDRKVKYLCEKVSNSIFEYLK